VNKIENESALVKEALRVGAIYAAKRGVGKIESTDSINDKITYVYRLLVHDKLIQPLARDQQDLPRMKHKLALWICRQLPADHPLMSGSQSNQSREAGSKGPKAGKNS